MSKAAVQEAKVLWGSAAIGETAGQVWSFLSAKGKSTLASIEREIEAPSALTQFAIGWLAREGKIDLKQEGRAVQVWLTESAGA